MPNRCLKFRTELTETRRCGWSYLTIPCPHFDVRAILDRMWPVYPTRHEWLTRIRLAGVVDVERGIVLRFRTDRFRCYSALL
jgi:hypothetical protein